MQQMLASEAGNAVADPRVSPSAGRVACSQCGKSIPLSRAYWYELEDKGLILVRLAGHAECFSGKTGEQIRRDAHESVYDIFCGDRKRFARAS